MASKTPALVIRCQKHPTYTGLKKSRVECKECEVVSYMRGASFLSDLNTRHLGEFRIHWGAK